MPGHIEPTTQRACAQRQPKFRHHQVQADHFVLSAATCFSGLDPVNHLGKFPCNFDAQLLARFALADVQDAFAQPKSMAPRSGSSAASLTCA